MAVFTNFWSNFWLVSIRNDWTSIYLNISTRHIHFYIAFMRNKSQILVKNDGNGPFFILFWPFSHIFAQFLRMRKLKMTRGKYFCTLNITYYLQYYILVKDFWFFWLKSKRTLVRVDFQKNWKFGSRAHLKKTPEISIFLCGALRRRTIFFWTGRFRCIFRRRIDWKYQIYKKKSSWPTKMRKTAKKNQREL